MGRKILIIWASVGGGHWSGTQALSDAMAELDPTAEVSHLDFYGREYAGALSYVPRLYPFMALRYPLIWGTMWHATNTKLSYAVSDLAGRSLSSNGRLAALLAEQQPDLIVCIAPCLGQIIADAVKASGRSIPIAMVVIDLASVHQGWVFPDAVWTSVPTEAAQQSAIRAGVPAHKIRVGGMPIRKGFWGQPADRHTLRDQLGLPQDKPVVLLMGGGDGADALYHITLALLGARLPYHLVAITGRNEKLRERLARATYAQACTVRGFTTNMADWMWASDLLVTKAGPNSIAEAMQCGLPLVLTGGILGQETANLDYVEDNHLGVVATKPAQVVAAVRRILSNPAMVAEIRQSIQRVHRPHAAHDIAHMILATLDSKLQTPAPVVAAPQV